MNSAAHNADSGTESNTNGIFDEDNDWQSDDFLPLDANPGGGIGNVGDEDADSGNVELSASHGAEEKEEKEWNLKLPPPWFDGNIVHRTTNINAVNSRSKQTQQSSIHPLTALHNEIVSFVQLIEPLPSETTQREELTKRIRKIVHDHFPDGTRVEVFGSQATGLFLPTSDIDLVIISEVDGITDDQSKEMLDALPGSKTDDGVKTKSQRRKERKKARDLKKKMDGDDEFVTSDTEDYIDQSDDGTDYMPTPKNPLHHFAHVLRQEWGVTELSYLELIENTRIPLVKFTHASTNISVDVSFNQPSGPPAAKLMKQYLEALPPLRPLIFVLKYFLAARCLNEPYTGGVGSFLLQLMIVSFLQHRERDAVNYQRPSVYNLGSLLLEFLELYGIGFNYYTTGISVRYDGFYFPKGSADRRPNFYKADRMAMMAMENPLEPTQDVGQSSFRYQTVQRSFAVAYKMLLAYLTAGPNEKDLNDVPSVLATILPPTHYMIDRKLQKQFDNASKRKSGETSFSVNSNKKTKVSD